MSTPLQFRKIPECDRCQFYSDSPLLPCSVHPKGVSRESCLDFREDERAAQHWQEFLGLEWVREGADSGEEVGSYNGETIRCHSSRFSDAVRLELLDYHPMFTGRCPECEMPIKQLDAPLVHWDCPHCGWKDDTV